MMDEYDAPALVGIHALGMLMPMHLILSDQGIITSAGPTILKLFSDQDLIGSNFFTIFHLRHPSGITHMAKLHDHIGQRLYLNAPTIPQTSFRGLTVPLEQGRQMLLNLSFGVGIIDAVRNHDLTEADFTATDLAIELLYVVEAKSAVMEELRNLNTRLQGAKNIAEQQALTDILTGLRNRRALDLALAQAIDHQTTFGLMHLDLDFFKDVNDTLGHAAGDHILHEVANILNEETRSNDIVGRIGGDEFMIILPGLADAPRMEHIARRIINRLKSPIMYEGKPCHITVSIGFTLSTSYNSPNAKKMLQDADQALYAAKDAGKGCVRQHHARP